PHPPRRRLDPDPASTAPLHRCLLTSGRCRNLGTVPTSGRCRPRSSASVIVPPTNATCGGFRPHSFEIHRKFELEGRGGGGRSGGGRRQVRWTASSAAAWSEIAAVPPTSIPASRRPALAR